MGYGLAIVIPDPALDLGSDPERARYARMRWNTPLSPARADRLLERLAIAAGRGLLDLGCGWAELLLRALARADPSAVAVGVDTDAAALGRGRARARELGLTERVTLIEGAAQEWAEPADRVICIGAAHAWGGATPALAALARLTPAGGRVLFGDGCWERPPTGAAMALFGEGVLPLADLVNQAVSTGWRVLDLSTADQSEWDEFESAWRAGRQEWVLANRGHERAPAVAAELDSQLADYVGVYRGVLGFCYLVLAR